jgi:hypothetical protein
MKEVATDVKMMTYEEADQKGLFNRGLILDYEGRTYRKLPCQVDSCKVEFLTFFVMYSAGV